MKNFLMAVVAVIAFATIASAQSSSTANATANGKVVCPVSVTNIAANNLEFGTVQNGPTGGTVTVNANATTNTAAYTGTSVSQASGSAITHAAKFTACFDAAYVSTMVVTPAITGQFTGGSGSAPVLSNLTRSALLVPSSVGCVCTSIYVGGKMTIPDGTTTGTWVANISLTVAY